MRYRSGLILLLAANIAFAQEDNLSWSRVDVAPGIVMLEGQGGFTGGNLGVLTGDDGVVLIDDGLPNLTELTLTAVQAATGMPVDFVINTHAHGDHTGANAEYHQRGATVIGHDNLRTLLLADSEFPAAGLPELTFNDSVTFHLNGQAAYVFHIPAAHTSGDAGIHFRDANVIHTGDVLFNRLFPFIDLESGGSVDGFIAGQQRMIRMADDETKIIPGHGPLASRADLQVAVDMLIDAQASVKALVDAGRTLEQIKAADPLADYTDWSWDFITTERMIETLYNDLTAD